MKKLLRGLTILTLLVASAGAYAKGNLITVMTQNQYLGADLAPIVNATSNEEFNASVVAALFQIQANNIRERIVEQTRLIAFRKPHLVALQEVYEFTCEDFGTGACATFDGAFNDHLQLTLDALAAHNRNYKVAAVIENLTLPPVGLPLPGLPVHLDADGVPDLFVGVVDRDVILARSDVDTAVVNYGCARPVGDGCHFQTIAQAMTLIGPINIERGFLGVDATIKGRDYRFVNTHLEVQSPSSDPLAPAVQAAQASELIGMMSLQPAPEGTELIIAGDFNSSPTDQMFPDPAAGPFHTPYQQMANGTDLFGNPISLAYSDIWTLNRWQRPGYTCCQDADLQNASSSLDERVDLIFSLSVPRKSQSNQIGMYPWNKTASGLWPSDHAAVVGRLIY